MLGERVRPEGVRVLRVADRDVARHSLCVAFTREDTEGEGHLGEHPLAVLGVGRKSWDAGEGLALGDELEGAFGLFVEFASFVVLYQLFWGDD